jgi:anaerobic ribonucleoside-triphosphate reductase activating protein
VDGFTISGGEPFHQAGDLSHLIECLHKISSDILVYTGYERKELQARQDVATDAVLRSIAVLIDGAYREDLNDNSFLRGSSNQHIHILNPTYEGYYREYLQNGHNQIQNFSTSDGIISVGIHRKTF